MSTPHAPHDGLEYDIAFTNEQASAAMVICQRCSKAFPPGTKLRLMHSQTQGSDRFFCSDCFEYYRNKKTTIRRTVARTPAQGMHKF